MKDEEPIIKDDCYTDMIKPIVETFYSGMMDKTLTPVQTQKLESTFTAGIALARRVRDRAIQLLP